MQRALLVVGRGLPWVGHFPITSLEEVFDVIVGEEVSNSDPVLQADLNRPRTVEVGGAWDGLELLGWVGFGELGDRVDVVEGYELGFLRHR